MLTSLEISKYRGFRQCRLDGMAQVTLFVGKNNSGKTSVLESAHFLASGGDPDVIATAAARRNEVVQLKSDEPALVDVSHLFNGHEVRPGSDFSITGVNGFPQIKVTAVPLHEAGPQEEFFAFSGSLRPAFALRIEGGRARVDGKEHQKPPSRTVFLSAEGAMLIDHRRSPRRFIGDVRSEGPPVVFISPDSLPSVALGGMWNLILRDKRENEVKEAMRILAPSLEDIVFQTSEFAPRTSSTQAGVLVSFKNDVRRFPLGSMGDGMRRLLFLSVSLIHVRKGLLLVDEIDTGLHHSVMANMWKLVVNTAKTYGIQVLATTHSLDCTRGLADFVKESPGDSDLVAVHRVDCDADQTVVFPGRQIVTAVEQEIEMRG